jgi:hypothetical protein
VKKRGLPPFLPSTVRVTVERNHAIVHCSCQNLSPFKSRDEISFMGEGCDTPSVTIVVTLFYITSTI